MLPVVLRFAHPAWGFVLPAITGVLTLSLLGLWLNTRHTASRGARLIMAGAVVLAASATLYGVQRPIVPPSVVLHAFGVFLCVAALVAWGAAGYSVKELGLARSELPAIFVACAVGALLGSRLLFVLSVPLPAWREGFALHHGGLSLWGALWGGLLGLWARCRFTQQSAWQWSSALAPAALLAIALGRVGCFASGSHFGRTLSDDGWSILRGLGTYPRWPDTVMSVTAGPPVWLAQVERAEIPASRLLSMATHPVQLYEALAVACLVGLVVKYRQRWREPREFFCLLSFGYVLIAVALEWLRGDVERGFLGPALRPSIALGCSVMLLTALLWLTLKGLQWAVPRRVRWSLGFVLGYGLLTWRIGSQLDFDHVRVVRLSIAQVLAGVAAACSALAASTAVARTPLAATAAPADPQ
jgi:prolipoprotein diacylglyceryltransferase